MDERIPVEASSGNVFADLGLPDAEGRLLKAELGRRLSAAMADRGLTQAAAGRLLGLPQPHVSNLVRGKPAGFSVERLVGYLNASGLDAEIVVTPAAASAGAREWPLWGGVVSEATREESRSDAMKQATADAAAVVRNRWDRRAGAEASLRSRQ